MRPWTPRPSAELSSSPLEVVIVLAGAHDGEVRGTARREFRDGGEIQPRLLAERPVFFQSARRGQINFRAAQLIRTRLDPKPAGDPRCVELIAEDAVAAGLVQILETAMLGKREVGGGALRTVALDERFAEMRGPGPGGLADRKQLDELDRARVRIRVTSLEVVLTGFAPVGSATRANVLDPGAMLDGLQLSLELGDGGPARLGDSSPWKSKSSGNSW